MRLFAPPHPIADTTWYSARQLDGVPRPLTDLQPPYPQQAHYEGVKGGVTVRMRIDARGEVDAVEVVASNPPGVFDAAVLEHLKQTRFTPGQRNGTAVRVELTVRLRFELTD